MDGWQPHQLPPRKPKEEIDRLYPRLRLQVFLGIFIGYAGFYLVRNNVSLIAPLLQSETGIDNVGLGIIANAALFAYGLSKFFSAMVSDQSNARYFMPLGLALSALVNIGIAFVPAFSASVAAFALVMFVNGWVQGIGWPPAGRVLVHWYSTNERGWKTSLWNTAHNVGGAALPALAGIGLAHFANQWQVAFWMPGVVALAIALLGFLLIRDTSESQGLPPIEEYRNDPNKVESAGDDGLSTWERIRKHVLTNRTTVMLAIANVFVYALHYGVLNWITVFLSEKHHAEIGSGMVCFAAFELAGILGTILCGYLSDKLFKGYRSGAGILFTAGTAACIAIYWLIPAGTAAGFTGLFGYLLGATLASSSVGVMVQHFGWNVTFILFLAFSVATVVLFGIVGRDEKALMESRG